MADRTYSVVEIAQAAYRAGFRGLGLLRAVAVALAESGGVAGPPSPTGDYGVWQINLASHPDVSYADAMGLDTAAQAAFRISNRGQDWSPWQAFVKGTYLARLADAVKGIVALGLPEKEALDVSLAYASEKTRSTPGGPGVGNPVSGLPNPLSGIEAVGDFFNNLRKPTTLFKAGLTMAATLMIVAGVGLYVFGPSSLSPREGAKQVIALAGTAAKGAI